MNGHREGRHLAPGRVPDTRTTFSNLAYGAMMAGAIPGKRRISFTGVAMP
jgi:hypothetical protein